jgi:hypothetical protein
LITSQSSPRIIAVFLFPLSLGVLVARLVEGHIDTVTSAALLYAVGCVLAVWILYLRLMLRGQGLNEVWWYDMPTLTRNAGSREQRWLAQWRLATMAKLVVSAALLVVVAVLFVDYWPQVATEINQSSVCGAPGSDSTGCELGPFTQ